MNKGEEYDLHDGVISMGRSENNDIRIYDRKSSRRHCRFHVSAEDIVIEDMNSTNGVKVNNVLVQGKEPMQFGDHVRIGQTVFLLSNRTISDATTTIPKEGTSSTLLKMGEDYDGNLKNFHFTITESTLFRQSLAEKSGMRHGGYPAFFTVSEK